MNSLHYEFYISGTPEQVWQALLTPEQTRKIYFGSVIESTFEVGSPIQYVGPGINGERTNQLYGEIVEYKPNEVFSHTAKIDTIFGAEHEGFSSRISYMLEPIGNCTKLVVIHDKWIKGDPSYDNTAKNWWMLLSSIKSLVETGQPLNF